MSRSRGGTTSADRIYADLRKAIILGHHSPGERLDLEELAARYGTSVTPVREALQMLSQDRLVTTKPHAGFYVTQVTLKELRDMLELRVILEVAAAERAAARITERQLTELEGVHAGYTGDDEASYERYVTENRRFHYLIAQASGNQELADALGRLHDRLARFFVFVHTGEEVEKRHHRLVDALRTRDPEVARDVILEEVNETQRITLEHVIQKSGTAWYVRMRPEEG
ncbi:MAG: GntR family transcriptional regulator [Anaerolineae bacterium]|jgi:DNA-binding GntR family transcriptional regulator